MKYLGVIPLAEISRQLNSDYGVLLFATTLCRLTMEKCKQSLKIKYNMYSGKKAKECNGEDKSCAQRDEKIQERLKKQ